MAKSILHTIERNMPTFSKGQKRIADYILQNYDKAAFMTASKLGKLSGVSESTVVRFASELGYDGYPSMQRALQEMIRSKLTSVQRMEVTSSRMGEDDILEKVLTSDVEMIRATLEQTSRTDFRQAVDAINVARKIYILGVRSSAALASFMAFYFNLVYDNVVLVDTASASEIFEQMFRIDERDVCIAISFPRYSKQTINALRFISDRGATILSITDSAYSPIASFAKHLLVARSDMASFVDSLVAPLSLVNALIVAATLSRRGEVSENFNKLEEIWEEYTKPILLKDEVLGTLTLDREMSTFDGTCKWMGKEVQISLDVEIEKKASWTRVTNVMKKLLADQEVWDKSLRAMAAQKLTAQANEWLADNDQTDRAPEKDPITEDEFARRILLTEFTVSPVGRFTAWYEDDDMFWGHVVTVDGTLKKGPVDSDIQG